MIAGVYFEARQGQFNIMFLVAIKRRPLVSIMINTVCAQLGIAPVGRPLSQLAVNSLARHHQWCQQNNFFASIILGQPCENGLGCLWLNGEMTLWTVLSAELNK